MPWTPGDVDGMMKGLTQAQKEHWCVNANAVLEKCIAAGGTDKTCAPKAVRIANKFATKELEAARRPDPALYKIREVDNAREAKQMEEMVKRTLHKLVEVGRTISAANEKKLRVAVAQVQEILSSLDSGITEAERFTLQAANELIEAESFDETRNKIRTALKAQLGAQDIYIRDVYPDNVVYEGPSIGGMVVGTGKLYQVDYTIDQGDNVTFGTPVEVVTKQSYEAVVAEAAKPKQEEPMEKLQEFVPLTEAKSVDGAIPIKIIAPGWGNSGFYSPEVLKAAAQAYAVGTHCYWNHPSVSEEADRPERSLKDLAGVLSKPAEFKEDGIYGPGIYSAVKPFSGYEKTIKEMAAHIGMSHRALGKASKGEMAGRAGNIIESIVKVDSVDFVTHPGAGGQIVQMFEAARGAGVDFVLLDEKKHQEEVERMAETEKIEGLEKENAALKAGNALREGTALVTTLVTASTLPEASKARLLESLPGKTVQKDGALDTEESSKVISEAITAEQAYVTALLPAGPGVIGLGEGAPAGETDPEAGKTALKESFKATYMSQGKTAEEATRLAEIAAKGR